MRLPVCAVTGSQFLTLNGWTELRNRINSEFPFRIFRDEGRSFLQVCFVISSIYFILNIEFIHPKYLVVG